MTSLTPNAQRLLRALVRGGPAYRADLARTLDVSRATVTNLANTLTAHRLVEEIDPEPGSLKNLIGTTPKLGVLASVMFLVDGVTAAIATPDGRLLKQCTLLCARGSSATERLSAGADLAECLLTELDLTANSISALHLAVDTQMDAKSGDVYAQRASGRWYGVNPKQYFVDRFDAPVHAQNTARLEALAEVLWGAGRAHADVLHVEVSHGVTSGHVVDGVLQTGARGGSGEIGHTVYDWNGPLCTCGNAGCLMQYVSIPALLRDHATASGDDADWAEFAARVRADDAIAVSVARRAAVVLGRMLVNTCHMIDPEALVLSGELPRELPSFVDDVAAVIRERALPLVGRNLRILTAQLQDANAATARAGIESLRGVDDVVAAATTI